MNVAYMYIRFTPYFPGKPRWGITWIEFLVLRRRDNSNISIAVIIIIKRQFIRRSNMARVTTKAPYKFQVVPIKLPVQLPHPST